MYRIHAFEWLVIRLDVNIGFQQFKNGMIFGEKIELKVYVNQHHFDFCTKIKQTPLR